MKKIVVIVFYFATFSVFYLKEITTSEELMLRLTIAEKRK